MDVKVVPRECIQDKSWKRYYQYTAIDEYSRLRYLEAFQTADTFSSAVFVEHASAWFAKKGIRIECVPTDNGFEFTKRFQKTKVERNLSLFEMVLDQYTPRHNGKVMNFLSHIQFLKQTI